MAPTPRAVVQGLEQSIYLQHLAHCPTQSKGSVSRQHHCHYELKSQPFNLFQFLYIDIAANGEGNGTPLQYSCLENPMDGGAWWVAVHGVAKSQERLSDFTFTFHFHALEKEMATHFSVLAWRIPGTGEPRGLPSMGSLRVRQRLKRQQQQHSC